MRWLAHLVAGVVLAALVVTFVIPVSRGAAVLDGLSFLLLLLATLAVGWILGWKRPSNPLGWLFMAFAGLFALQFPAVLLGDAVFSFAPGVSTWLYWYGSDRQDTWSWVPPVGILLTQIPLHFPDGRLPSPRWRWFRGYTIFALLVTSFVLSTSPAEVVPGVDNPTHMADITADPIIRILVFVGLLAASFVGAIASLFARYHYADGVQRAQLRWVLWAVSLAAGTLVFSWVASSVLDVGFLQGTVLAAYALIPISIGIAVLRYRLYDIDRIITRTATYTLVTVTVLGIYLLVVTSISLLLPRLPSLGVALATLAAAALFLPLLRLVQRWIDRRFNREQYNAAKVVEIFGERLRNGADPHTAAADLVDAAEQTLHPSSLGIWTAGGSR